MASTSAPSADGSGPERGGAATAVQSGQGRLADLAALLSFAALAFWVTARLWLHPGHQVRANRTDQALFEWMLAHGARVLTDFDYPFFSDRMNVPDGVNLVANTSVLAVSLPLTPITLAFGPRAAFVVFLTLALMATALAWYLVLSRYLVGSRGAAWIGALFCAFAPNMISHANGHPNIVSQFLVPLIVWRTLELRRHGRWLRNGVFLGLLIVAQGFINLEILLMTAVGLGVVVAVLAVGRRTVRADARPFLAGLGVAAAVSVLLLGYPIYVQQFGPGAYQGLSTLIRGYRTDLAAFFAYAQESVAGDPAVSTRLTPNDTEENAFFGWPLVILVAALVWWLRRDLRVIALAVTGALFALLSLGRSIQFNGEETGIWAPWALLEDLPLLHSVVPTRWTLAVTPVIGVLLAIACARSAGLARQYPAARNGIRFATVTVLAMALLPIAPTPLPTSPIPATPEFVSSGAWRTYADGDRSVVTLPLADATYAEPLRWSAQTGLDLRLARGYFLAPDTRADAPEPGVGVFSGPPRPTSTHFSAIWRNREQPPLDRTQLVADLRYWQAGAVVLAPHRRAEQMRERMTTLLGAEPVWTGGLWVWDVRDLTG